MRMYEQSEVDRGCLAGKRIAVLGYGSQGRAQALNLRDSGHDVVVGLRPGSPNRQRAQADGLAVGEPREAAAGAALVAFLTPDMTHPALYREIEPALAPGAALLFAHGFNIHYRRIEPRPDLDVVLIAPKGAGDLVRRQFVDGHGVPCLVAIDHDSTGRALQVALAFADGIGGTRAGVGETTFAEETETDLFGEQAVLCGGATELIVAAFETLVEAGYQPEVAYYECMHELKLIADLLHEGGLKKMHDVISGTAAYGDVTRGPRVVGTQAREQMRQVLAEIREGTFAREWIAEHEAGEPKYRRLVKADLDHPIEEVGRRLRRRMPWLVN